MLLSWSRGLVSMKLPMRLKDNPDLRNDLITRGRDRAAKFTARDFVKGLLGIFDEFEAVRRNWK